jgi:hypothetical protein
MRHFTSGLPGFVRDNRARAGSLQEETGGNLRLAGMHLPC